MLLDRDRVVGAALDGRVVGDDHAPRGPADPADAGDDAARPGAVVVVHPGGGQRAELEERAAGVEQPVDPVAGEQLAAGDVLGAGGLAAAAPHGLEPRVQLRGLGAQVVGHGRQVSDR